MHPNTNVAQERVICGWQKKMIIALTDTKVLLNKRTELISKCRHSNKFILNRVN